MAHYTPDGIAAEIIAEGRRRGITDRGIKIALATALVESNLRMYANNADPESLNFPHDYVGSDANSVGVFQQRAPWWGTTACRMDVACSAGLFYEALAKLDYTNTARLPGSYAQEVQRSAYPGRYDERYEEAGAIFNRLAPTVGGGAATKPGPWRGDPVWLPDVLRAAGVRVAEAPGWRERGHGDFDQIWGVIVHHTGSNNTPVTEISHHPELGLASQIHLARDGLATITGVGVAWHAGAGSYPGIPGGNANAVTIGIEAQNSGTSPTAAHRQGWPDVQYDAYVRTVAAILHRLGHGANRVISHKEWAGAAQGKWDPGGVDMQVFRADVAGEIARLSAAATPAPEPVTPVTPAVPEPTPPLTVLPSADELREILTLLRALVTEVRALVHDQWSSLSPFRPLDYDDAATLAQRLALVDSHTHIGLTINLAMMGDPEHLRLLAEIASAADDPGRWPDRQEHARLARLVLDYVEAHGVTPAAAPPVFQCAITGTPRCSGGGEGGCMFTASGRCLRVEYGQLAGGGAILNALEKYA